MKPAIKISIFSFVFMLNTRSPLPQSVRLHHYSFSLDTKDFLRIPHFRRVLLWGVKGQARLVSRHFFVLGSHVRAGFYSLAQHLLLVKMSQCH